MSLDLSHLKLQILDWAETARQRGLLSTHMLKTLENLSEHTPANLFETGERPLVVGFFGGTGVGKSTLLNRLAGESIARTSVERPTSREVTLYLHQSVQVDHLPADFPVDKIKRAVHNNDQNRHILWIDMPDFDSAETANRQQVNDWLPHIDLLIYVVSPERYRDDNGWRLLQQHGQEHAWCFVINHWDRGNDVQRQDFQRMLIEAGLTDPLLFCTDSSGTNTTDNDEFPALKTTITSLADRNTIIQLEARGVSIRAGEMQASVNTAIQQLGSTDDHTALAQNWRAAWQEQTEQIERTLQWKFAAMSQRYRDDQPGALVSIFRSITGRSSSPAEAQDSTPVLAGIPETVFDTESFTQVSDALVNLAQHATEHQVPSTAVRQRIEPLLPDLPDKLNSLVNTELQQSLAAPGTAWQRSLYRLMGVLTSLLPLLAIGWAGYRIVSAFNAGSETPAAYVSSNFAINAVLLVLLAWIVPFFLRRWVRPSRVSAARRGLRLGTAAALGHVEQLSLQQLDELKTECAATAASAGELFSHPAKPQKAESASSVLSRALVQE